MGGSMGGYGGGGGGGGGYAHSGGPITAAVQSRHSIEVRPVPTQNEPIQPQIIEVDSGDLPIILHFNSRSSRLMVKQTHTPAGPGEVQSTSSEDEPHRLVHEVLKPVIQEVREVITPYRRVIQEVRPVVEEIQTIVAKGEGRRRDMGYDSQGMGGGGGGYGGGQMNLGLGGGLGGGDGGYGSGRGNGLSMGGSGGYGGSGLSMGGTSSSKSYKS